MPTRRTAASRPADAARMSSGPSGARPVRPRPDRIRPRCRARPAAAAAAARIGGRRAVAGRDVRRRAGRLTGRRTGSMGGRPRHLRRRRSLCVVPRNRGRRLEGLASRPRHAARDGRDRARRLQGCALREGRRHDALLPTRRRLRRLDRRPGRSDARLHRRLHLRRRSAAAISGRHRQGPVAGAADRLGFATEGGRRPALVPPLPEREARGRRSAALDRHPAELELHVRRLPFDGAEAQLR